MALSDYLLFLFNKYIGFKKTKIWAPFINIKNSIAINN